MVHFVFKHSVVCNELPNIKQHMHYYAVLIHEVCFLTKQPRNLSCSWNESSQNQRAHEHLNPPECEIIMASWCHFSGESSEQMAKIWELNLVYTAPLRTTKKLVWFGFKRISKQRGFSKISALSEQQHSSVHTRSLDFELGADSRIKDGLTTAETLWRN